MVVFLTGARGVGKSTALRRALRGLGLGCAGFMTDFGSSRREAVKTLRLLPWAERPEASAGAVCARLGPGGRQVYAGVFDTLGVRLVEEAAADSACDLILMDELGFLEAEAARFRAAVLAALAGPKPVLGVVRQGFGVWESAALGEVWTVTEQNRDEIPAMLRKRLFDCFPALSNPIEI